MKLYIHEYNSFTKTINTREVEAEEKPKTYVVSRGAGVWETRLNKNDVDKIKGQYPLKMYTLTPDPTPFIKELIARKDRNIESYKKRLEHEVETKTILLKILDGERVC